MGQQGLDRIIPVDSRAILHADMDCFFAAVEVLDFPELRGKPVVVGGSPTGRGVVAAASYEARKYGVRSAMAMAKAIRLCPHLVIQRGRYHRYRELSDRVFDIFYRYTPVVQGISIDEAFLDVTGSRRLHGGPIEIAQGIRAAVAQDVGLVVSVGVAPNKFVAKLSSDLEKPDGLTVAPFDADELAAWLAPLPVRRMWGVGPASEAKLARHGFRTFGDLQRASEELIRDRLGDHGLHWRELSFGRDARVVQTRRERARSIGHETTFPRDVGNREELRSVISRLADSVAARVRKAGLTGRTVMVKIRFPDFRTITRNRSIRVPTDETDTIFHTAWSLFEANVERGQPLRLVGVTMLNLSEREGGPRNRTLFDSLPHPDRESVATDEFEIVEADDDLDVRDPDEEFTHHYDLPPDDAAEGGDDDGDEPVVGDDAGNGAIDSDDGDDDHDIDTVFDHVRDKVGRKDLLMRGRDLREPEFRPGSHVSNEDAGYRKDRDDDR